MSAEVERSAETTPVARATDDVPPADPLTAILWLHRLFGDWEGDSPTCGCGATPPETAQEELFGDERWHDAHLAAAVAGFGDWKALHAAANALEAQPPKTHAQYVGTLRLYADEPWRLSTPPGQASA